MIISTSHIQLLTLSLTIILISFSCSNVQDKKVVKPEKSGVSVLLVDTDRKVGTIKPHIYGHFLEHINHSVVDGLYAEQIRGQGFEGDDFLSFWNAKGSVKLTTDISFGSGKQSVLFSPDSSDATISQNRIHYQEGVPYNGSVWVKMISGEINLELIARNENDEVIGTMSIQPQVLDWQEMPFSFISTQNTTNGKLELTARGKGEIYMDFISLMTTSARQNGMLRPDLLQSLQDLSPPFVRWPGGSFASIYNWKDGIGPLPERKFTPNAIWGNYSDYYGFGTEEFMELCQQLESEPMIVLKATSTDSSEFQNAMDWVHYLIDPPTTEWGNLRAENGHPAPYSIPYFQIDNEPMNHGLSPDEYAEIVNLYGSHLRKIAPESRIVACGQKRSNDMIWTQKLVDIAGDNFDILGCHNYEYEPENFQVGVRRIEDYLEKAITYIRHSKHPDISIGVLEWGLCRTYDWRAGLHAAGSLISYEKLSPKLEMSCPALLMRNTEDDPEWTAFIYHDHVSWFPGAGYVVEKLFREHFAENQLAFTSGTFKDLEDRKIFFDDISQMKPEDFTPNSVDAIATMNDKKDKIIIKAVNYESFENILLVRLQGSEAFENAQVKVYSIIAQPEDKASIEDPDKIKTEIQSTPFSSDMSYDLAPYSVMLIEISKE